MNRILKLGMLLSGAFFAHGINNDIEDAIRSSKSHELLNFAKLYTVSKEDHQTYTKLAHEKSVQTIINKSLFTKRLARGVLGTIVMVTSLAAGYLGLPDFDEMNVSMLDLGAATIRHPLGAIELFGLSACACITGCLGLNELYKSITNHDEKRQLTKALAVEAIVNSMRVSEKTAL